jgi:hypothetical protein
LNACNLTQGADDLLDSRLCDGVELTGRPAATERQEQAIAAGISPGSVSKALQAPGQARQTAFAGTLFEWGL